MDNTYSRPSSPLLPQWWPIKILPNPGLFPLCLTLLARWWSSLGCISCLFFHFITIIPLIGFSIVRSKYFQVHLERVPLWVKIKNSILKKNIVEKRVGGLERVRGLESWRNGELVDVWMRTVEFIHVCVFVCVYSLLGSLESLWSCQRLSKELKSHWALPSWGPNGTF